MATVMALDSADTISEVDYSLTPAPEVANTYRLEPTDTFPFDKVRRIMAGIIQANIGDLPYDSKAAANACTAIADQISIALEQVESLARYNLICRVAVGNSENQSLLAGSRCLWHQHHDKLVTVEFRKYNGLFAMALLFAFYSE